MYAVIYMWIVTILRMIDDSLLRTCSPFTERALTITWQVDENWTVKLCDFGLSAVKRSESLQDNGVAPGTVSHFLI